MRQRSLTKGQRGWKAAGRWGDRRGQLTYDKPYFGDHTRHDLRPLFEGAGLQPISAERAHMSKVMTFDQL